jgi:hypothetical protein
MSKLEYPDMTKLEVNKWVMEQRFEPLLKNKNGHSRDERICIEPENYKYEIDGTKAKDQGYTGVTRFVNSNFKQFDADAVIEKMMKSPKWPNSKYFGMTPDEIKDLWSNKGKLAAQNGTEMHYAIEAYYNGLDLSKETEDHPEYKGDEFTLFQKFEENRIAGRFGKIEPYRTEWEVFDEDAKVYGIIDMVYKSVDEEGNEILHLYDWKRAQKFEKSNRWENALTESISHLPGTDYWHYCLQLNMYKFIVEKYYNKPVGAMYLVRFYPGESNYERARIPDLQAEIIDLRNERIATLK